MAKIIIMNVGIDKTCLKFKFSQEIINNGENAGSKNKRGRLMKNMKSPNSGLRPACSYLAQIFLILVTDL